MSAGVEVKSECVEKYEELKLKKLKYVLFSLSDDFRYVLVAKTAPPTASYDDFVEDLKKARDLKQCRYGVFDAVFKTEDGSDRSKRVFFLWAPDEAKVKEKMIYTSTKDTLRKKLVGIGTEVQASDDHEISWANVLGKIVRN